MPQPTLTATERQLNPDRLWRQIRTRPAKKLMMSLMFSVIPQSGRLANNGIAAQKHNFFAKCVAIIVMASFSIVAGCGARLRSDQVNSKEPERQQLQAFEYLAKQSAVIDSKGASKIIEYESIIIEPRLTGIELYSGWNRESEANKDIDALAYISGPTFEVDNGQPNGFVAHGDIKGRNGLFLTANNQAAAERAYISIDRNGELYFGFGRIPKEALQQMKVFIGGLHAVTNHLEPKPPSYKGVYKTGLSMADVRIVYGLRSDGRLEVLETKDGVYLEDLIAFVDQKKLLAAYLPDHASKSRLIVPLRREWSDAHAVWISGGRPSITQMPFMLKIVQQPTLPD